MELIKLKVKLCSVNRRAVLLTLGRGVVTGNETEFMREEGSETEADILVLKKGIGIPGLTTLIILFLHIEKQSSILSVI